MWNVWGSDAPFWFGGVLGIVSALLIAVILRSGKGRKAADRSD
jgi:hypothetical protein